MKQDQRKAGAATRRLHSLPNDPSLTHLQPCFASLHRTKNIFKKRGRAAHKNNRDSPKVTQQQPTSASTDHPQTQTFPLLQSQQSVGTQSCHKDLEPTLEHSRVHYPSQLAGVGREEGEAGELGGYLMSIGEHLLRQEGRCSPPLLVYSGRLDHQARIGSLHLIFGFCLRYGFKVETTFLAFSIYHRIAFAANFEHRSIALQAMGSLFVAAKYQEIAIPKAEVFSRYVQEEGVGSEQVLGMQSEILLHLNFNLGLPTVLHFIDLLRIRYGLDTLVRDKLISICYKSLNSLSLWQEPPSLLAMAALNLLRPQLDIGQWRSQQLQRELQWRTAELLRVGVPPQEC